MIMTDQLLRNTALTRALQPFLKAYNQGRLAFLVGAGASWDSPACRPLAGEISSALGSALWLISTIAKDRWKEKTIQRYAKGIRFESLMQILATTTGSLGFLNALKGGRPNQLHRILAKALRNRCPVLTTNFDELIERVFQTVECPQILTVSDDFRHWRKRTPRGVLAKLHGTLSDLDSMCATMQAVGALGPAFMWDHPRGEYFARVRRDFPMAVFGYAGADDSDILPRLRITESNKPLLWLLHAPGYIRIATERDINRLATTPGLAELLYETNATVIAGNTLHIVAALCGSNPKVIAFDHRRPLLAPRLLRSMRRTTLPYIADFLIGRILYESGRRKLSRRQFAAIRLHVGERYPGLAARCLTNEATITSDIGDWATARRQLETALPKMRRYADERAYANACLNLAVAYRHLGKTTDAEMTFRILIKSYREEPKLQLEWARAQVNLADMLFEQEQLDSALKLAKSARLGFKKAGDYGGVAMAFGVFGKILFARNDVKNAIDVLSIALWHTRVACCRSDEVRLLNNIGTMQRVAGMLDAATESYAKAREIGEEIDDPESVVVSEMGNLTVYLAAGRLKPAIRKAKVCLSQARALGLHQLESQTRGNLALALMDSGEHAKALPHFKKILPILTEHGPPYQVAFTLKNIGECLVALGKSKQACIVLEKAEKLYLELGMVDQLKEIKNLIQKI